MPEVDKNEKNMTKDIWSLLILIGTFRVIILRKKQVNDLKIICKNIVYKLFTLNRRNDKITVDIKVRKYN